MRCTVFIATSIDGFIAREDGALDWLPGADPDEDASATDADGAPDDSGYTELMQRVDVLVIGRATYDTVIGFDVGWPYTLPVVVLTNRPLDPPPGADVRTERGPIGEVLDRLGASGSTRAYVDGGAVVQQALAADLVDEITVTTVPVLLGSGIRLFGALDGDRWFVADTPRLLSGGLTQTTWRRAAGR